MGGAEAHVLCLQIQKNLLELGPVIYFKAYITKPSNDAAPGVLPVPSEGAQLQGHCQRLLGPWPK